MKLSHSGKFFVRVFFRETQELVFDAHDKAFEFYGGICRRGIYDDMKTTVKRSSSARRAGIIAAFRNVLASSDRTGGLHPRVGIGEKGQVENQVGNLRDQMFGQNLGSRVLAELNAWLEDRCVAYASAPNIRS